MWKRIPHKEEAITGTEQSQDYAERHRKYDRLQYRGLLKDIKAVGVPGHYLEVGAGPGTLTVMMAEDNPDITITALDLSPEMVAAGREYIKERGLERKIRYVSGDTGDRRLMGGLGEFDVVYSAFSLHHWGDPIESIGNLLNAVKANGVLCIYDLKRVWWLYVLPFNGGFMESIRASYLPREIEGFLQELNIRDYRIKSVFPLFMQSIIVWK